MALRETGGDPLSHRIPFGAEGHPYTYTVRSPVSGLPQCRGAGFEPTIIHCLESRFHGGTCELCLLFPCGVLSLTSCDRWMYVPRLSMAQALGADLHPVVDLGPHRQLAAYPGLRSARPSQSAGKCLQVTRTSSALQSIKVVAFVALRPASLCDPWRGTSREQCTQSNVLVGCGAIWLDCALFPVSCVVFALTSPLHVSEHTPIIFFLLQFFLDLLTWVEYGSNQRSILL